MKPYLYKSQGNGKCHHDVRNFTEYPSSWLDVMYVVMQVKYSHPLQTSDRKLKQRLQLSYPLLIQSMMSCEPHIHTGTPLFFFHLSLIQSSLDFQCSKNIETRHGELDKRSHEESYVTSVVCPHHFGQTSIAGTSQLRTRRESPLGQGKCEIV